MLVKFEQNCMGRTKQNFELFDQKKLIIFNKVLTPFLTFTTLPILQEFHLS